MAWYPSAVRKPVARFRTPMRPVRVNLHTAVSNVSSLWPYFSQPGKVCSHFYVRQDGTVEQYVDTAYRAAADLHGNPDTISVETWDGYGATWRDGDPVPAWTAAQVASLRSLIAWIITVNPSIPARLATTSRRDTSSHGLSWHRLGVPATRVQASAGVSQTGGMLYSSAAGKICPGDARIAQIPGLLPTSTTPAAPATKRVQELLAVLGYYTGRPDGDYGPRTRAAVTEYQTAHHPPLVVDGDAGPRTTTHMEETMTEIIDRLARIEQALAGQPRMSQILEAVDIRTGPEHELRTNVRATLAAIDKLKVDGVPVTIDLPAEVTYVRKDPA